MRNECSIICDILPLYMENMVSEDTAAFVKEHIENCPECRAELEMLRQPVTVQPEPKIDIDAEPLKRLKKALLMKKIQTVLCTAAVLLALVLSAISFLTAPEYFPYSPELVTVTEGKSGDVTLSFSSNVTNYNIQQVADPDGKRTVYHLEVWTSVWDSMFGKPGAQDVTIKPEDGRELLVFFTQYINDNSSESSVCLYGTFDPNSGGWLVLPGFSLGYWLIFSIVIFVIFGAICLNERKRQQFRRWMERVLLIPVAYALGHLCVMGFHTISYSEGRDFQLILAIGVLLYCAMLLALNIYHSIKELRNIRVNDK